MLQIKNYSKLYKMPTKTRLKTLGFLGSGSELGNGRGRGDGLGINQQMQDRGLSACDGSLIGGAELFRFLNPLAVTAKSARIGRKIRIF